ncbi:hypothetical protein JKF63_07563 [Porcisia hertigi]|uniref:Reverse transcriptase domain-containing protein n=1 Tax=Porcisia hertigi TaxID=2761500 RepID=A0A836YHU1_9TRYP|nr:hypothetical protein JKF63_07563 [Porcisia hertigi]
MLIILVDFSKAFATVEHSTLVKLLMRLPAHLLKHWLRNLLMHRDARVKLGNRFSPQYGLKAGVSPKAPSSDRHCSPCTPLLFWSCWWTNIRMYNSTCTRMTWPSRSRVGRETRGGGWGWDRQQYSCGCGPVWGHSDQWHESEPAEM